MPKLPSLNPKEVVSILVKKGFSFERSRGSHYIYHNPNTKRMAVVPFHKRNLPIAEGIAVDYDADWH